LEGEGKKISARREGVAAIENLRADIRGYEEKGQRKWGPGVCAGRITENVPSTNVQHQGFYSGGGLN